MRAREGMKRRARHSDDGDLVHGRDRAFGEDTLLHITPNAESLTLEANNAADYTQRRRVT